MNIILSAKHMTLSDKQKDVITTKLERLDKYFQTDVNARATVSVKKGLYKIEVTIPVSRAVMRAEATDYDMYSSVDEVVSKLSKQLRKHKTRLQSKGNETIRFENVESIQESVVTDEIEEPKIVRRKSFDIHTMSEEEAILQMEMLGHDFFVFNDDSGKTNVLYKRKDGNYGLIQPA